MKIDMSGVIAIENIKPSIAVQIRSSYKAPLVPCRRLVEDLFSCRQDALRRSEYLRISSPLIQLFVEMRYQIKMAIAIQIKEVKIGYPQVNPCERRRIPPSLKTR